MNQEFDGQRAFRHIEYLSKTIGARVSGTPQEKQAADYVQNEFKSYGLKPVELDFDVDNDVTTAYQFEILEPALGEIPALPLAGSPDTPPEGLTGEVVFVEALQPPYVGPHIEGKIVILANDGLLGRELQPLLKFKPLALVHVGHTMGLDPNTFHVIMKETNHPYQLVPTFHITYDSAVKLWNAGVKRARLTLQTARGRSQSYAVYADVKGSLFPDEIVVIAGHMDSVPRDPGATDNAAGTATMLELARIFSQRGSFRTLRFAAWGSEEGGLVGSFKYVLELKKRHLQEKSSPDYIEGYSKTELEQHLLNINLDVLGMSIGHNAYNVVGPQAVKDYIHALTCEMGVRHICADGLYGSDHLSFANVGVPGVSFQREGVGTHYMHTAGDTIDLIDPRQLKAIGDLQDVLISRTAAQGYVWPFERSVPTFSPTLQEQLVRRIRYAVKYLGMDPELAKQPGS